MGSWNFSDKYLTAFSYQLSEAAFDESYADEQVSNITDKITSLFEDTTIEIGGNLSLEVYLERVKVENGYYSNVRVEPEVSISIVHNSGELIHTTLTYSDDNPTYLQAVGKIVLDEVGIGLGTEIDNLFYKVNNILLEHAYAFTTGYCATQIKDEDAVLLMHQEKD